MNAISDLSSSISHDFNNILSVILGYAELIKSEVGALSNISDYSDLLITSIHKAMGLTSKLLMTTPIEQYKKQNLDLKPVLNNFKDAIKALISDKITIEYKIEENCFIFADISQIESIVINLIINARAAMHGEGKISLNIRRADSTIYDLTDYVILSIRDNEEGIDKDIIPFIFEPFFSTKNKEQGHGLGLSTVYGMVMNLNGKIDVQSQTKGENDVNSWSEFSIYIPALPVNTTITKLKNKKIKTTKKINYKKKKILLIDDNNELLELLNKNLKHYHEITICQNSFLLNIDELSFYDMIITDISMPGVDGPELISKMRDKYPKKPVIFISGYLNTLESKSLEDKYTNFLMKPFETGDLLNLIEKMS